MAFSLAEKHFDIPALLDVVDVLNPDKQCRPDEQCFITYLSEFPVAWLQNNDEKRMKEKDELVNKLVEEAKKKEEESKKREEETKRIAEEAKRVEEEA